MSNSNILLSPEALNEQKYDIIDTEKMKSYLHTSHETFKKAKLEYIKANPGTSIGASAKLVPPDVVPTLVPLPEIRVDAELESNAAHNISDNQSNLMDTSLAPPQVNFLVTVC